MSKETGGPAFPTHPGKVDGWTGKEGMTLRDYFAAQSLPGLIQAYATMGMSPTRERAEIVSEAYGFSDAMLAHRNREAGDE